MHPQVWDVVIHLYRETNRANWKITVFHGSIIYRWFFSIAILVQPLLAQFCKLGREKSCAQKRGLWHLVYHIICYYDAQQSTGFVGRPMILAARDTVSGIDIDTTCHCGFRHCAVRILGVKNLWSLAITSRNWQCEHFVNVLRIPLTVPHLQKEDREGSDGLE